jgi:hypothetical protein
MTIPHMMNCSHQGEGWCLECVNYMVNKFDRLHREVEALRRFGNKDCTAMADEWLARKGWEEDEERIVPDDPKTDPVIKVNFVSEKDFKSLSNRVEKLEKAMKYVHSKDILWSLDEEDI